MPYAPVPAEIEELASATLDRAYDLHSEVGPGLLEKYYRIALAELLRERGIPAQTERYLPATFRGVRVENAYRIDVLVKGALVIEAKATRESPQVYARQVATYLQITELPLGIVINFGHPHLRTGVKRVINTPWIAET